MKFIFVLFDSLNRLALQPYGGAIETPNFQRLADRGITFDRHYVGSMPCMPARRDLHTGRTGFVHRSWGPLEPYDNSFARILREGGIHAHLISDHFHYFEDGGGGYHTSYDTFEFVRGQEYDTWKAMVQPPLDRYREIYAASQYDPVSHPGRIQHLVNREHMRAEADMPGPRCFAEAFDFLDANRDADDWLLHLELFDPHEPFHAPAAYRRPGDSDYVGPILDWPNYARVEESPEAIAEIRANYAALVRMTDAYLGRLLDYMDAHAMWEDTCLLMTTDHGFLLSEHEWWGKCRMPYYEEVTHIPLIYHHPGLADRAGTRCASLTQTTDVMPSILEAFGHEIPDEVLGRPLSRAVAGEDRAPLIFGIFAGPIGVTDGRWVMFHYPPDPLGDGLHEYTLNPQHMRAPFDLEELRTAQLAPPFDFTKGLPLLKIDALAHAKRVPNHDGQTFEDQGFALYDLAADPRQERPLRKPDVEMRLYDALEEALRALDAPEEVYGWYQLSEGVSAAAQ